MKFTSLLTLSASATFALADVTLREAAKDFLFGVAGNTNRFNNDTYMEALSQFNYMVAENGCKLSGIQAEEGVFDFTDCDAHYEKALELGMKFRGHCLIWHNYQPEWFQNLKGDDLKNAIINHITTVLTHYKGKIDTWDIVNEALADKDATEENPFVLRNSFLLQEVPDYIDIAFKTAREIDPNLKLFYNEYYNEGGPHLNKKGVHVEKSNATFNFAKDLLDRGVPLDGVGLQYHVRSTGYPTYDQVMEVMAKYAEIGLEVQITEIDVRLDEEPTPELYELQARLYAEALKACLDSSNCTAFLIWGVSDFDSWITDGYATIFDENYAPKSAYYSLLNVLKEYNNSENDSNDSDDEMIEIESDTAVEENEDSESDSN